MGILGDTLTEIAEEKAGIIKPGCAVISAAQEEEVRSVLVQKAAEHGCPISFAEPEKAVVLKTDYHGQTFLYPLSNEICSPRSDMDDGMPCRAVAETSFDKPLHIRMAGTYQIKNAATVLTAIQALRGIDIRRPVKSENGAEKKSRKTISISDEAVRSGLEKTEWAGRFTCIHEQPVFIVDGAHNEDAAIQLRKTLEACFPGKRFIYIMGVFKDKEYEKIAAIMEPLAKQIYTIDLPDQNRTLDAQSLKDVLDAPEKVKAVGDIRGAVDMAFETADAEDIIVAFGSLSYLGQVMELVKEKEHQRKGIGIKGE